MSVATFYSLPDDIIRIIYSKLNRSAQIAINTTSKSLKEILKNEEKKNDNVEINFRDATNIKSYYLSKKDKELEIYPNVFISIDNYDPSENLSDIKIEIKNYDIVSQLKNRTKYDKKIIENEYFIYNKDIDTNDYQLYTFKFCNYYCILYVDKTYMFLWRTNNLNGIINDYPISYLKRFNLGRNQYIYKFISKRFDNEIVNIDLDHLTVTLKNGKKYHINIDSPDELIEYNQFLADYKIDD